MRGVRVGLLALVAMLAGCYRYEPVGAGQPVPAPGTRVMLELTDQGRVAMERQVGAEVARVEGAVVSRGDSGYVVGVTTVIGVWGSRSRWQGERVTVREDYVRRMSLRRLSASRTVLAAGGATLGFVAFVLSNSLIGGGSEPGSGKEPPPPAGQ